MTRMEIEGALRRYMQANGSFIFMKFSAISGVPYPDVLRVSGYCAPYSKTEKSFRREMPGCPVAVWPPGTVSALAAVCTMEANRREGLPL